MKWDLSNLVKGNRYAIRRPSWDNNREYVDDVGEFTGSQFRNFEGKNVFYGYCEIMNEIPLEYWVDSNRIIDINEKILKKPCVLCDGTGVRLEKDKDGSYFCSCKIGVEKQRQLVESDEFKNLLESYRRKDINV